MSKASFSGKIMSIQPRIRLLRSFDEASHTYLGYALQLKMINDGQHTSVSVGIGKAVHEKHQFKVNDVIFETFCYGPLSCPRYKAGPKRKVEGRK